MTATVDTRKRSRDEDGCDSMPLSKRINNLHINNSHSHSNSSSSESISDMPMAYAQDDKAQQPFLDPQIAENQHQYQMQMQHLQQQNGHNPHHLLQHQHHHPSPHLQHYNDQQLHDAPMQHPPTNHQHATFAHQPSHQQHEPIPIEEYAPELNPEENPFYYNKNRILYDLHVARMQRNHP